MVYRFINANSRKVYKFSNKFFFHATISIDHNKASILIFAWASCSSLVPSGPKRVSTRSKRVNKQTKPGKMRSEVSRPGPQRAFSTVDSTSILAFFNVKISTSIRRVETSTSKSIRRQNSDGFYLASKKRWKSTSISTSNFDFMMQHVIHLNWSFYCQNTSLFHSKYVRMVLRRDHVRLNTSR